jgi:hypothetical protein
VKTINFTRELSSLRKVSECFGQKNDKQTKEILRRAHIQSKAFLDVGIGKFWAVTRNFLPPSQGESESKARPHLYI